MFQSCANPEILSAALPAMLPCTLPIPQVGPEVALDGRGGITPCCVQSYSPQQSWGNVGAWAAEQLVETNRPGHQVAGCDHHDNLLGAINTNL